MTTLTRRPDWMARLHSAVDTANLLPFSYGTHDCCLWAAHCVDAMCDTHVAADIKARFNYASEDAANAVIEAGGSDPKIITASAPLDVAAAGAVTAAFHMSGQVCTSAERLYVVDAVHDDFIRAFVAETLTLRVGNGLDKTEIGPLVSKAARDKVMRLIAIAVAKGAKVECGGRVPDGLETGWFYAPTILTGCTPDMDILNEECFGPVAAVMRVAVFLTLQSPGPTRRLLALGPRF